MQTQLSGRNREPDGRALALVRNDVELAAETCCPALHAGKTVPVLRDAGVKAPAIVAQLHDERPPSVRTSRSARVHAEWRTML
jgi:hypothetical protein